MTNSDENHVECVKNTPLYITDFTFLSPNHQSAAQLLRKAFLNDRKLQIYLRCTARYPIAWTHKKIGPKLKYDPINV